MGLAYITVVTCDGRTPFGLPCLATVASVPGRRLAPVGIRTAARRERGWSRVKEGRADRDFCPRCTGERGGC